MRLRGAWLLLGLVSACATPRELKTEDVRVERIVLAPTFELARVSDTLWIHTTYKELTGVGSVPSNGLMLATAEGVVLIDTPWTPAATRTLLEWISSRLGKPVTDVIVTHSHDDRTGGVAELAPTTKVHALPLTSKLAAAQGVSFTAEALGAPETKLMPGGAPITVFAPGAGHAPDNVVVWLPEHRLLFGGCFIKSAGAEDLGNVADANLASWSVSLKTLQAWVSPRETPARPVIVVPGHGGLGGTALIVHTQELVSKALSQQR